MYTPKLPKPPEFPKWPGYLIGAFLAVELAYIANEKIGDPLCISVVIRDRCQAEESRPPAKGKIEYVIR